MKRVALTWDTIPSFANDEDIGEVVLGYKRRGEFSDLATLHEARGMPRINPLWGGRHTPSVRAFLDRMHGLSAAAPLAPDGLEGKFDDNGRRQPRRPRREVAAPPKGPTGPVLVR